MEEDWRGRPHFELRCSISLHKYGVGKLDMRCLLVGDSGHLKRRCWALFSQTITSTAQIVETLVTV
jgi:hypothetical protein